MSSKPPRVLVKLSGEALGGKAKIGIDDAEIARFASEIRDAVRAGVQIGVVVGGGNFVRGARREREGSDRVGADFMGMLATLINGLALKDGLRRAGLSCEVMSALAVDRRVAEGFTRERALELLGSGVVLIFVGGTGNPFFSTDSAAALRAAEIDASLLAKATQVDGVYDRDPALQPKAQRFESLSYGDVLTKDLAVMDAAAVALCRENGIPIRVFDYHVQKNLARLLAGEPVGTLIATEEQIKLQARVPKLKNTNKE